MSAVQWKPPGRAERWFVIAALVLFMHTVIALLRTGGETDNLDNVQGEWVDQVIFLTIHLITYSLIAVYFGPFLQICRRNKAILFMVLLPLASTLWSYDPAVTFRHSVALFGTTMFGIYVVTRFRPGEFVRLVARALAIVAVLSLFFAVCLPQYGRHTRGDVQEGEWRGVFTHKNGLGAHMTLAVITFFLLGLERSKHRRAIWAAFALSLGLVIMSGSRTAWLACATLLILVPVLMLARSYPRWILPIVLVTALPAAGAVAWVYNNSDKVLEKMGRDPTLSGRTALWELALEGGQRHPWLGYGYGAFWLKTGGAPSFVWHGLNWIPDYSHNAFLDIWLDLGFVGVVLFTWILILAIGRAVVRLRRSVTTESVWFVMYMVFVLLLGLTELPSFRQTSYAWVLLVPSGFYLTFPPARPTLAAPDQRQPALAVSV